MAEQKSGGSGQPSLEDASDDRPTVIPDFDLNEFAKQQNQITIAPKARSDPPRAYPALPSEEIAALEQKFMDKVGSMSRVPVLRVSPTELRALPLDPSSGFLISNMDGISTLEMILDVAGMSRLEAQRLLLALLEEHVIELC